MNPKPRVILAAVDLESDTSHVLREAAEIASDRVGSVLHVVHVVEVEAAPVWVMASPLVVAPPQPDQALEVLRKVVRDALHDLQAARPGACCTQASLHIAWGKPVDEIVWLATHLDTDVLVLGTHGRRGLHRFFLGSVAERVARLAGCQVSIARPKRHDAEWRLPEIAPSCPDCAALRITSSGARLLCPAHEAAALRSTVSLTSE